MLLPPSRRVVHQQCTPFQNVHRHVTKKKATLRTGGRCRRSPELLSACETQAVRISREWRVQKYPTGPLSESQGLGLRFRLTNGQRCSPTGWRRCQEWRRKWQAAYRSRSPRLQKLRGYWQGRVLGWPHDSPPCPHSFHVCQ